MKKAKIACLLLFGCLTALLSGCAALEGFRLENDSLLFPPAKEENQQAVLEVMNAYLGEETTLAYPSPIDGATPFFECDLDADGVSEMVACYYNTSKSQNVMLALLNHDADMNAWQVQHMDIEGAGVELDFICSVQLTADGAPMLAVGFRDAGRENGVLQMYRLENGALHEVFSVEYQQCCVASLNGDETSQLVLVRANDSYHILQVCVYGGADANGAPQEESVTMLDSRLVQCTSIYANAPADDSILLTMDFIDDNGNCLGEVLCYTTDRFVRCFTEDNTNIPNFSARPFTQVSLMDIDDDGLVEMPRIDSRVVTSSEKTSFYFISWYLVQSGSTSFKSFSYVDLQAGYLLILPKEWRSQVVLQPNEDGPGWSVRRFESGEKLISVQLVEQGGKVQGNGFVQIGNAGQTRVYVSYEAELSDEEKAVIASGVRLLYN